MISPLEIVKKYSETLWAQKDLTAIDQFFSSDIKIKSPLGETIGAQELKTIMQQWLEAFPDLIVNWKEFVCQENTIVSRWHAYGTHQGKFLDYLPTDKKIDYSGVTIYKISDNKITDYWALVDMHTLEQQILQP